MADLHAGRGWAGDNPHAVGDRDIPRPRIYKDSRQQAADDLIEKLSWLMDRSIPIGGGYSIGLDPIIGLVPGIGDLISTAVSGFIIYQAQQAGAPKATVLRMMVNVGIDAAVGAIPFLGDAFDFAFKANQKNLELYRDAMSGMRDTRRDTAFLIIVLAGLGVLLALPILAIVWLAQAIF
jgi:hypothetical protein